MLKRNTDLSQQLERLTEIIHKHLENKRETKKYVQFKRHEDIVLTKKYYGNEAEYPKFDNYDAINVNKTKDIPIDYDGVMGVPITFLHKFNPEQFELIKFRKGNDDKDLSINGKCPYFRILIKKRGRYLIK